MCLAFRHHTLLPLDDCRHALPASIPHLGRSAPHRLFQRHEISRLPDLQGDKPKRSKSERHPIGYLPIDIAAVRTGEGTLWTFVAIDRTGKFAFAKLVAKAGKLAAAICLREVIEARPYRVHTVLTASGVEVTKRARDRHAMQHAFGRVCDAHGIAHRPTKVTHPWTNAQVGRMTGTITDATVKRSHYGSHDQLRIHLTDFVAAYDFARRLTTRRGLRPYEHIVKCWTEAPYRFKINLSHHMPGLGTWRAVSLLRAQRAGAARPGAPATPALEQVYQVGHGSARVTKSPTHAAPAVRAVPQSPSTTTCCSDQARRVA